MLALKIIDVKDFTNKLFIGGVFDQFWLTEATITTFNTFSIDGRLQEEFFDTDERDALSGCSRTFSLWKEIKPYCYQIIRGKRTPLHFKIVFQLSHNKITTAIGQTDIGITADFVNGLYLNIQYKNKALLCTTGTSFRSFLPDRQLDQLWDSMVLDFFKQNQILCEKL